MGLIISQSNQFALLTKHVHKTTKPLHLSLRRHRSTFVRMHIESVLFAVLILFLAAPNGSLALKEEVIPDLHSRACIGLPFDSIHLQNTCVVDVRLRATCAEIQRFFQTLNKTYTPGVYSELPELVKKRLKQEPAIQHATAGDNLCVNSECFWLDF